MSEVKVVSIKTLILLPALVGREQESNSTVQTMAEDVYSQGIIEPLIVRAAGDFYEVVCGLKRWKAAVIAGLDEVPVDIRNLSDKEAIRLSITDNMY